MSITKIKKQIQKNISINNELLNKYNSVEEIFSYEKQEIKFKNIIKELIELKNIDLKNINVKDLKKLAHQIFFNNHIVNSFNNNGIHIIVGKKGINESVEKIYNNYRQRNLLKEHLMIFSALGTVIEKAKLVNQVYERKNRKKYISWHYFLDGIIINNKKFLIEFEVVSMDSGENHYRIQRLELNKRKTNNHDGDANKY